MVRCGCRKAGFRGRESFRESWRGSVREGVRGWKWGFGLEGRVNSGSRVPSWDNVRTPAVAVRLARRHNAQSMTEQRHDSDGGVPGSAWSQEAAPDTFYAKKMRSPSDTYPYTAVRVEARDGDFRLLSAHWSAALALKEMGERLVRREKAAAYLARWDRIESDNDPRLKDVLTCTELPAPQLVGGFSRYGRLLAYDPPQCKSSDTTPLHRRKENYDLMQS